MRMLFSRPPVMTLGTRRTAVLNSLSHVSPNSRVAASSPMTSAKEQGESRIGADAPCCAMFWKFPPSFVARIPVNPPNEWSGN
jgi:hypothetical protein